MKTIFESVVTLWSGCTTLVAVLPRLYSTRAPQDSTLPYAVFNMVGNPPLADFQYTYEQPVFDINIYDDIETGDATIHDIAQKWVDQFDFVEITDSDGFKSRFQREAGNFMVAPDGDYYIWTLTYRCIYKPQ